MNTPPNKLILWLVLLIALSVCGVLFMSAEEEVQPSTHVPVVDKRAELIVEERQLNINQEGAFQGVTIIPQSGNETVEVIGMDGVVKHQWDFDAARARILPNCNVLVVHASKWGLTQDKWRGLRDRIREYSWEGDLLWEYQSPWNVHHDVRRLENGNTVFLYRTIVPKDAPTQFKKKGFKKIDIRSDGILEINNEGEIIWQWEVHDSFPTGYCGKEECPPLEKKHRKGRLEYDWTHANVVSIIPENKWFDGGDKRFRPGNFMILLRSWSTVLVIDRETKKPVWEYHGDYKGGISGGHESHMIPKGLPGAGNLLIFDNGRNKGTSFALEVNPQSEELVWVYDVGEEFFSEAAGTLQRLPNGNTLISEDVRGRTFEVTPEKEIVWEVQNPYRTCRPERYSLNHCENF